MPVTPENDPAASMPEQTVASPVLLRDGDHALVDSSLDDEPKRKLLALGYISTEQVKSASDRLGDKLDKYVGAPVQAMFAGKQLKARVVKMPYALRTATYSQGIALPHSVRAVFPANAAILAAVANSSPTYGAVRNVMQADVSWIGELDTVRDQGFRGTCAAHAAAACHEQAHFVATGRRVDFSEQFLYCHAKLRDPKPQREGTLLKYAVPVLPSEGCCLEATWPYFKIRVHQNEGQGPAPHAAVEEAVAFKSLGYKEIVAMDPTGTPTEAVQNERLTTIRAELAAHRCVAVSVAYYDDIWETDDAQMTGNLTLPFPGELSSEGHAICLVGYQDLPDNEGLGGGRFLFRNSWGGRWATTGDYGVGYGTIPYSYLATYLWEAYSLL